MKDTETLPLPLEGHAGFALLYTMPVTACVFIIVAFVLS